MEFVGTTWWQNMVLRSLTSCFLNALTGYEKQLFISCIISMNLFFSSSFRSDPSIMQMQGERVIITLAERVIK